MESLDRALGWAGQRDPQGQPIGVGFMFLSVFITPLSSLNLEQCFVKYPDLDSAVFREIETMISIPTQAGPAI